MVGHSLDGYLDGLQFGVGVPRGGESILHEVNRLVEDRRDENSATLALPDCTTENTPCGHAKGDSFILCLHAWYLDDGTIVGDTLVVGKVSRLIMEDGPRCGLHLNVDKTELFWPNEHPRSRWQAIGLLDTVVKINDPQSQLSFDIDLRSTLKRIVTASGPVFGDWQWRLATLPFEFRGLGVYSAGDVLNYAFITSRL
nr:hypothetical protein [Tanacetum cinerariifolium]